MNPNEIQDAMRAQHEQRLRLMLEIAETVLTRRLTTLLALILTAGEFCWAMSVGGWDRLAVAGGFAVAAWCLTNLRFNQE